MDFNDILNLEPVSIKNIPEINEKWIQDYIANDPSIIGLGDLEFRSKEKVQPNAGRLDLLLQDSDENKRYEVELQLGKTDESHIIRTIEYWDIERKRYPQYEHCAVIIAEDITSRFLNIIQLFNGHIPLVAIQMKAYKLNNNIAIIFTKIFDEINFADDDDDGEEIPVDKDYWEKRGSKETVEVANNLCELAKEIDKDLILKYTKTKLFITKNGIAKRKYALLHPKKNFVRIDIALEKNNEIDKIIEENDFEALEYNTRRGRYRIRIVKNDLQNKKEIIKLLFQKAYNEYVN